MALHNDARGVPRADSDLFIKLATDLLSRGCSVRFRATGTSMHPTIQDGEPVTVAPLHGAPVTHGDVLLCRHGRGPTAHRVVAIRQTEEQSAILLLRGDNAMSNDGPVAASAVLGRVVAVSRGGAEYRLGPLSVAHHVRRIGTRLSPAPMRRLLRIAAAAAALLVLSSTSADAQIVTGTYVGNGTDNREIVASSASMTPDAVGFTPDVVIVDSASTNVAVIRTSTMTGDNSKPMTGATGLVADAIQALVPGGFEVGTDARVNANGTTYHFVAFKASPGKLKVGSYTGNGVNGRVISGVGFVSDLVFVLPAGAARAHLSFAGAASAPFDVTDNPVVNWITAVAEDTFTLGTALAENNSNGAVYHYVAWNELGGQMDVGYYTGDGTDNRNITNAIATADALTFRPEYVIVKQWGASGVRAVHHSGSVGSTTDQTLSFDATASSANQIQQLQATGFQVGSDTTVNGNTLVYLYMAWGRQLSLPAQVVSGSYTGNGSDNRQISGVGFTPELVIVKGNTADAAAFRSATMAGDTSKPSTGSRAQDQDVEPNLIQSLTEDGFVVGNDVKVNSNGVVYEWIAFRTGPGEMEIGSYLGNGADNRNISGVGFQPDYVILLSEGRHKPVQRSSAMAGDISFEFDTASASNLIQALQADGFQVGSDALVNASATNYHYVAWKTVAGKMNVGSYTGNATDSRSITLVGFQPEYVIVRPGAASGTVHHPASIGIATDSSLQFLSAVNLANSIQALETDGFQVGTHATVNTSGTTYYWMAWQRPSVTAVRLRSATATLLEDGRYFLEWHTGYEVNNLGFNVYRDDGRGRVLLTPVPVAGSALMLGPGVEWTGGFSYRWIDSEASSDGVTYWIEDVDLSGTSTLHGPIAPVRKPGDAEAKGENSRRRTAEMQVAGRPRSLLTGSPTLGTLAGRPADAVPAQRANTTSDSITAAPVGNTAPSSGASKGVAVAGQATSAKATQTWAQGISGIGGGAAAVRPPVQVEPTRRNGPSSDLQHLRDSAAARRERIASAQMREQWKIASRSAARIAVRTTGWYRIGQPQMIAAGIDPSTDPQLLQLFVDGVEQPLEVRGESDGRLDAEDAVEFYATGTDTPYTDTRIYWLIAGNEPGERIRRVSARASGEAATTSFPHTVERKEKTIYFAALLNGEAENFFGALVMGGFATDEPVQVVHRDVTAADSVRLEVTLQGVTEDAEYPDHAVTVRINGNHVGVISFDGREQGLGAWDIDPSWLVEGQNTVSLEGGSESDVALVDTIRLTYMRRYAPENDQLQASLEGGQAVTIGPFSNADIRVVDVTETEGPTELHGDVESQGDGFVVRVRATGAGTRSLLAFTGTAVQTPAVIEANVPSSWHKEGQSVDLAIISHGDFVRSVESLKRLREAQGYRVAVVDVKDVYDEFSFGEKTPFALRRFLAHANQAWSAAPRFVLLVGNATTDPRDYYGFGEPDFVPTKLMTTSMLETASDDWYADGDGDGYGELAIVGRLPVRTAEEAAVVVNKIVAYEQMGDGAWARSIMLVADTPEPGGFDFRRTSAALEPLVPADYTVTALGSNDTAASREDILTGLNDGQLLVNYVGHGSIERWGSELFSRDDVPALRNGSRLPFVVAMNCLNGFFQGLFPEESLAESLLRAPNGGAIAVWASSAVTPPHWQSSMNRELFRQMFGGTVRSVGEAVAAAKRMVGDRDIRQSWIFFGDPLTRLKGLPEPQAALSETPQGGGGSDALLPQATDLDPVAGESTADEPLDSVRAPAPSRRLVDFNGDGLDEPLLHDDAQRLWTMALNGTTGFAIDGLAREAGGQAYPARLNDDLLTDVFWYDAQTGAWAQSLSRGNGRFAVTSGVWAAGWTVHIGDFDGNGRSDVFLHDIVSGIWFECLTDGVGGFTERTGAPLPSGSVHVANFNTDGFADLFIYDSRTGESTVAMNDGRGDFATVSDLWHQGWSVQVGDLDGNGQTDLLLWHPESPAWMEALNRAPGHFTSTWYSRPTGRPHLLDLNGDLREDVLWHDLQSGRWSLRLSRPSGTFAHYAGQWESGWDVITGNLDGSAGIDILLHNPEDGAWRLETLGPGGLQPTRSGRWTGNWSVVGVRR